MLWKYSIRTPGAGLTGAKTGKAPSDRPALKSYRGKPAVRNFRGAMGTSASFEARSAPWLCPTRRICENILAFANENRYWYIETVVFHEPAFAATGVLMAQKQDRRAAGCLTAVLIPSVLVTLLFFVVGMFGVFTKLAGREPAASSFEEPESIGWFSVIVTLFFSFPILLVLVRALYASIVYLKNGKKIRIVTWKTIAPASVLLGVPGLVFIFLGLLGILNVDLMTLPWALAGTLLLIGAPFLLYRLEKSGKPAGERSGDGRAEDR